MVTHHDVIYPKFDEICSTTGRQVQNAQPVRTYTASGANANDTITYSLSGDDADKFDVSTTGLVTFKTAPDYETPDSTAGTNVYKVKVVASDSTHTAEHALTITVTDELIETIVGTEGDDTLDGSAVQEVLLGGDGDDTYIFTLGDGKDTISDTRGTDTIRFVDFKMSSLVLEFSGDDMLIKFRKEDAPNTLLTTDVITVKNGTTTGRIEQFDIGGIVYDVSSLVASTNIFTGTGDDLTGGAESEWLSPVKGKHFTNVYAGDGDDFIIGGGFTEGGNDGTIFSENGNDTVILGGIRHVVVFGYGDDILAIPSLSESWLNAGPGVDTIHLADTPERYNIQSITFRNYADDPRNPHMLFNVLENPDSSTIHKENLLIRYYKTAYDNLEKLRIGDEIYDISSINIAKRGNVGSNSLYGSSSTDWLSGLGGDDTIFGKAGNDYLFGGAGNDLVNGEDGNDYIYGASGNDILNGEAGNDTLSGDGGSDTLSGGSGNDVYLYARGDGADTITDSGGDADTFKFKDIGVASIVFEVSGDDILVKFKENDTSDTLSTTDIITVKNGNLDGSRIEKFQTGDEVYDISSISSSKVGSSDADTLSGGDGGDWISGGGGDDTISGGDGDDIILGDAGDDTLYGGTGNNSLSGGEGDDLLSSQMGNDFLSGGNGDDELLGGEGNDIYVYSRGDGNDTITDSSGTDTIRLGDIDLRYIITEFSGDDIIFKFNNSADTISTTNTLTVKNGKTTGRIEKFQIGENFYDFSGIMAGKTGTTEADVKGTATSIDGGSSGDWLSGRGGADNINGGDGNDYIFGGDDNDTLGGENGNDYLSGGLGSDMLQGGSGNDVYLYSRGDGADTIIDSSGSDAIKFIDIDIESIVLKFFGHDLIIKFRDNPSSETISTTDVITIKNSKTTGRIEKFQTSEGEFNVSSLTTAKRGTSGDDKTGTTTSIDGDAFGNWISAGGGNDFVRGHPENDYLVGGAGDDELHSGAGNDYLFGGTGDDTLNGKDDNDTLYGGSGNDSLIGSSGYDYLFGGDDADVYIYSLSHGIDTIADTGGDDTFKFDNIESIVIEFSGDDMLLKFRDDPSSDTISTTDIVTVKNSKTSGRIEKFQVGENIYDVSSIVSGEVGTSGSDTVSGGNESDWLSGGGGADNLLGNGGSDYLFGGAGDDSLSGGDGNDTLYGGEGTDSLSGGAGDDVYMFYEGIGLDTIDDASGSSDMIRFIDIELSSIVLEVAGDNLKIKVRDKTNPDTISTTDIITVNNGKTTGTTGGRIEKFQVGEDIYDVSSIVGSKTGTDKGDSLSADESSNWISGGGGDDTLSGGENVDYLFGGAGNDDLSGGKGNDYLYGESGNDNMQGGEGNDYLSGGDGTDSLSGDGGADILYGELGDDSLSGGDGNDTIDGGAGNDSLIGGDGDDIYYFGRGDGQDVIVDSAGVGDELHFGDGSNEILFENVVLAKSGSDLLISFDGYTGSADDKITIKNWNDSTPLIETFIISTLEYEYKFESGQAKLVTKQLDEEVESQEEGLEGGLGVDDTPYDDIDLLGVLLVDDGLI